MISITTRAFDLFCLAWDVTDLIFSLAVNELSLEDIRAQDKLDPKCQTTDGLFIESKFGVFKSLWTPWGIWHFAGNSSGLWGDANHKIKHALGIRESDSWGPAIGKIYSICYFRGTWLPMSFSRTVEECTPEAECLAHWKYMNGLRNKKYSIIRR